MGNTELKPCPFCGSEAEVIKHSFWDEKKKCFKYKTYSIKCNNCFAETYSFYDTEEFAIKIWNTRKPMDNIVAELEELKTKYNKLREVCEDKIDAYELECKCIQISKDIEIVKRGGVE